MPPVPRYRILILDDNQQLLVGLERALRRHFDVTACTRPEAAVDEAARGPRFEGFVTDLEIGEENGFEVIDRVAKVDARLAARAIVLTGATIDDAEFRRRLADGYCVLKKGEPIADLVNAILLRAVQHP